MAFGKHRKAAGQEAEQPVELPDFDDFNYDDTLDSITAGLPGTEPSQEEPAAPAEEAAATEGEASQPDDTLSDTPEAALTKLERQRRARMQALQEQEESKQKRRHRKKKERQERERSSILP